MVQNITHYTDLLVWQKAVDLAEIIFRITESFPKSQTYILVSQMQRAATSVSSNIAEGRNRHSIKEFIYHLNVARGSIAELETQTVIAERVKLLNAEQKNAVFVITDEISKMIYGLIRSLRKKTNGFEEETMEWLKPVPETCS